MVVKVYISGMSGSKEVKKRQQRVTMIMDSKHIEYSIIDITEPGQEGEKDFMQTNAAHKGCTISDPNPRHALPPQLFNDTEYCGDYDDFDLANEVDSLEVFLKVAPPPAPAPVPVETTEHKNGDAAAADDENKENKTEANKDDNDAAAEDAVAGEAVDGPNENPDEVTVENESTSPTGEAPEPEANGQLEGVDEEANSKLVTDNVATKDDPPQSVGEIDKEPDGSLVDNSETLPPGPDEETPDNVDETEQGEVENEPQKDDDDVEHGSQAKEEPAPAEQATEEVNTTTNEDERAAQTDHTNEAQQDADLRVKDFEAHDDATDEKDDAESNPEPHPVEPEDPVERMAAEPEEPEALPDSKDEFDSGGSDDDRSQSRRSSTTDEQEEIEDVRPPNVVEERPSSPAASKDAVEVRPVARGDDTMEADNSDSEEQELLRASAAALAGQSEDAQEIIEVDDEPLQEAEDTAEQTGAEEEISSKLVDTDDPMLAEQEQEE